MGLLGCPGSFQQVIEKLMDKIQNINVNIDDLPIHSQTHKQKLDSLELVMQRLEDNHMKNNLNNCFFGNMRSAI